MNQVTATAPTEPIKAQRMNNAGVANSQAFRDKGERSVVSRFVLPAILLLVYLLQCAWFIQSQSLTFDEPINIVSGLEEWRTGQYSGGMGMTDHPPLARLLCTLPAIESRFQIDDKVVPTPESVAWHNSDFASYGRVLPSPEAITWHTRPVNAILGTVLGLLLWFAARGLYSTHAANFVLALFAFSPSLIAHFSLAATNDGAMTLMLFATVLQLARWRQHQSWAQALLMGFALGGMLLTKASSVPFFVMAVVLMLVLKHDSIAILPSRWNWRQTLTAIVISGLVVWGAYRFHISKLTLTATQAHMSIAVPDRPDQITRDLAMPIHVSLPIPAFEYARAIAFQLFHDKAGHPAFLLGRNYIGGSRLYFPVTLALKWPIVTLLLLTVAIGLICFRRTKLPRNFWLWSAFPVIYLALAEISNLNLGERYILPAYPFALLACGSVWQYTRRRPVVAAVLLLTLAIHVADVMRYAPDYLSYFNPFVRSDRSYRLLSDSNVDWGQGLVALRKYQDLHPNVPIHLAYFGSVDPAVYGIRAIPLMPNERVSGTVVVSATYLTGQTLPDPNGYHWVLQYPVESVVNHSLYIFSTSGRGK